MDDDNFSTAQHRAEGLDPDLKHCHVLRQPLAFFRRLHKC